MFKVSKKIQRTPTKSDNAVTSKQMNEMMLLLRNFAVDIHDVKEKQVTSNNDTKILQDEIIRNLREEQKEG